MSKPKKKRLQIYVDGSAKYEQEIKRGRRATISCSYAIYEKGKLIKKEFVPIKGTGTSNTAEFVAVIYGIKAARDLGGTHCQVFSDSTVVVNALNKLDQKCSVFGAPQWIKAINECRVRCFEKCSVTWIPREKNFADAVLRKGLGMKPDSRMKIKMSERDKKADRKQRKKNKR